MKRLNIILLALIIGLAGCQKDSPEPIVDVPNDQNIDFPTRPVIKPGENSGKTISKSASIVADLNTISAADLVAALIYPGPDAPTITNVTYTGALSAAGIFTDLTDVFGFGDGIILSSGNISYIQGPNTQDGAGVNNAFAGDADLTTLSGYTTHDAAVLEFDIECSTMNYISFQYVFASEEYNEYVGSPYNDVFGFYVDGANIALIPGTIATPVSVNTLNCGNPFGTADNYCALLKNNDLQDGGPFYDTEMDGFTVVLTAETSISPGVHHIKLAIADASDFILDSDVLIKGESFVCGPPVLSVEIDIKPGSDPNSINCNNPNEAITVAILTTANFDATTVDHETVLFEGAAEFHINNQTGFIKRHEEDVDLDGDIDLVLHFRLHATDLDCYSTEGTLVGKLYDGTPIIGDDYVNMISSGPQ